MLKNKIKNVEIIKVCPNCKSTNIAYATQLGGANMGGGDHFYCKTCDYGRFKFVIFNEKKIIKKDKK